MFNWWKRPRLDEEEVSEDSDSPQEEAEKNENTGEADLNAQAMSQASVIPPPLVARSSVWWQPSTLPDLLVKAFPDAHIQAPKVLIVGSQSSGKTQLIISMIFLYLIDHPAFTEAMGESLLRIFRTGRGLTTRRPISIALLDTNVDSCRIQLSHDGRFVEFGTPEYDLLIVELNSYTGNEIFEEELAITIEARHLPNQIFKDMPGLTNEPLYLHNSGAMHHQRKKLETLVEELVSDPNNTVVMVESAPSFSVGSTFNSLIWPVFE